MMTALSLLNEILSHEPALEEEQNLHEIYDCDQPSPEFKKFIKSNESKNKDHQANHENPNNASDDVDLLPCDISLDFPFRGAYRGLNAGA